MPGIFTEQERCLNLGQNIVNIKKQEITVQTSLIDILTYIDIFEAKNYLTLEHADQLRTLSSTDPLLIDTAWTDFKNTLNQEA